jgi:hypothetical protein
MIRNALDWVRNNLKIALPIAVVLTGVLAFLAFGVFGIHTKFIDDEVNESGPVFASGAAAELPSDIVEEATTDEAPSDVVDEVIPEESNDEVADSVAPVEVAAEEPAADAPTPETVDDAPAIGEVVTLIEGSFVDRSHPGSGVAKVLNDGSEQRFLRFEDFETDNGPDLFVYLTRADAAADSGAFGVDGDFVNLGRLKGNVGEQNYEIPVDVDLGEFDTVVVWCDRFSVAFTAADLS